MSNELVEWIFLEDLDYNTALELQTVLHGKVSSFSSKYHGFLLLVEHKPVITIGRFGNKNNILLRDEELRERGIGVYKTSRGGDVTYHGPGQLVGYPIINLKSLKLGVESYVNMLEKTLIGVLRNLGINGTTREDFPGVWTGGEKIAAIGLCIKNWTSMHGFSLNVTTDLESFSMIIPCGIKGSGVTSIEKLLNQKIHQEEIAEMFAKEFGKTFNVCLEKNNSLNSPRKSISESVTFTNLKGVEKVPYFISSRLRGI